MKTQTDQPQELSRGLKSRHVQLIALGGTIGTGLFLGSGKSIHSAGPAILLAYIITGIMCFLLMRALGEILLANLNYRSFIEAIKDFLGPRIAAVVGWTYWACWIAVAMGEIIAIGTYIHLWLPHLPIWVPGLLTLGLLLSLNLATVSAFGETEFWFAMIKIVAIIALVLIGIGLVLMGFQSGGERASVANLVKHGGFFATGFSGFMLSFQMVVFGFVGIEMVGMTASGTADPARVIPKAINAIPLRIILFYIGALAVIMTLYPWNRLDPNNSPFVMVFKEIGIPGAADVVNFVVLTAAASACNSSLYTTGRLLAELTHDVKNPALRSLSRLSKRQVPARALAFSALMISTTLGLSFVIPNQLFVLVTSVATTCFLFIWAAIVWAHLRFKKQHWVKTRFAMPLYPLSDYLILIFLAMVLGVLCFEKETLLALIFTLVWLAGLYLAFRKMPNQIEWQSDQDQQQ